MSHLATAIDLIDLGTTEQVHLRVFRPCVNTVSGTIDGSQIAFRLVRPYGRRDIHLGEDRATLVVVTAINLADARMLARVLIIHYRLNDIARRQNLGTIGTTKNLLNLDGRLLRHIHHGTCCHTLVVATSVGSTDLTMEQIDNGGDFVAVKALAKSDVFLLAHAQAIITTGTEDLHIGEFRISIGDVDKHIAAVLCLVVISIARETCTTAKDCLEGVMIMIHRTDIHEGAVLLRHGCSLTVKCCIGIVVRAIATTENAIDTA